MHTRQWKTHVVSIVHLKVVNLFVYTWFSYLFTLLLLLIKDTALELQLDLSLFNIRPDTIGSSKSFSDKYCLMVGSTPICRTDISDNNSNTLLFTFFFILTRISRCKNIKMYVWLFLPNTNNWQTSLAKSLMHNIKKIYYTDDLWIIIAYVIYVFEWFSTLGF